MAVHAGVSRWGLLLLGFLVFGRVEARLPDSLRSYGPVEHAEVVRALAFQGITEPELGFDKKWAIDSFFRLKIVDELLDRPLHGPGYCDSSALTVRQARGDIPALLLFVNQQCDVPVGIRDTLLLNREIEIEAAGMTLATGLQSELARAVRTILGSFSVAEKYRHQAFHTLKPEEFDRLLVNAPVLWGDEDDTTEHYLKGALHRELGRQADTALTFDMDTVLPILRKIDRRALALAGLAIGLAVQRAVNQLQDTRLVAAAEPVAAEGVTGEVWYYAETKWGRVAVGGAGQNQYQGDFALVIDAGGDDRYEGRIGAGISILTQPFGICIDLAGDDYYHAPNRLFNFGAGLLGVGMLVDLAGRDVYRGYHNSEGIGMYGYGVLLDAEGDDWYEGGWNCQGTGMVGAGLLLDLGGNDNYRIQDYGQGFASVWGYGLSADCSGNDVYYAGGKYFHRPLLPSDYRSFAQGFAIGFRPDCSGGIGFLYDEQGNDFYNAEVFAQACSYWYSLGMIYEGGGNDHYNANQYSQGAGIHLAVGILIDRDGDDQYFSRLGPTQGEGHDLSVGILIDRKGNDSYSCSGGQGIGLTNSFALFVDAQGHDNYMTTEAIGQGTGTWARGFGSMGVFIDADGDNDRYVKSSPGQDNSVWTQGTYGTGISLPAQPKPGIPPEETTYVADTLSPKRPIKDVFKDASVWQVGEARNKTRRARKELIARGAEAAAYIAREKLNTKSGLELEAMAEFARNLPDTIAPYLFQGLRAANRYTRANAAHLIGQAKLKDGVDSLLMALNLPGFRPRWAILALGEIGEKRATPQIAGYLQDRHEPTRIATAATIGKLKDPYGIPQLIAALNDPLFTVRSAAEQALVDIGDSSLSLLLTQNLRHWQPRARLHGIRALGTLGAKLDTTAQRAKRIATRKALIEFLDDREPAIRGLAVEMLGKMRDESLRAILRQRSADEVDSYVRRKYEEALKE